MGEQSKIVIRGIGLITPLANGVGNNWKALLEGQHIVDHARVLDADWSDSETPNVIELGDIAAREALALSRWGYAETRSERTALVVGTSKGPADEWLLPMSADGTHGELPDHPPTSDNPLSPYLPGECESVPSGETLTAVSGLPSVRSLSVGSAGPIERVAGVPSQGLHEIATVLAERFELAGGPKLTVSAACASGLHALIRAAMLLQHGDADRALVIATESSLHPAFIQSFRRLGVLASPGKPCRPFDVNRTGFLISEAAAAIVLDKRTPKRGDIILDGYALGADASHLTSTDPQATALKRCLAKVIAGQPVDLIHAHATGTIANDPIELAAIESVSVGSPAIYSHKGSIGHSLGASGMVATVLNVIAHRKGIVPGNVNTTHPLTSREAGRMSRTNVQRPIHRSLAIAAGFGGATGVVGLRTVTD